MKNLDCGIEKKELNPHVRKVKIDRRSLDRRLNSGVIENLIVQQYFCLRQKYEIKYYRTPLSSVKDFACRREIWSYVL